MTEKKTDYPSREQLERELERVNAKLRRRRRSGRAVYVLALLVTALVLALSPFVSVYRIYGASMNPTLREGDLIVALNHAPVKNGDLLVADVNGKLLIRRCVAQGGMSVTVENDGRVLVDGRPWAEDCAAEKSHAPCDVTFPCQVPPDGFFVLGDNRPLAVDSRSTAVGCLTPEQVIGPVVFRVWPLDSFGPIIDKQG